MRIATGGIIHESNTFCRDLTGIEAFRQHDWCVGQELIEQHRGVRTYQGGVIDGCERMGIETVPTFFASATPSGTISQDAFDELLRHLLEELGRVGPVDGVCLTLHGAGVAEEADSIETEIIRRVRQYVGLNLPIAVTLDLHGNITQEAVELADALLGVNFYPHTDSFERGQEAVELISRIVNEEVRPQMYLTQLPMLLPAAPTDLDPARTINDLCWGWEAREDVLDCTFFHGFGRADIPRVGVSVLAISNGDPELARQASEDVARAIWDRREEFRRPETPPGEAFRQALRDDGRPVVLNERSDNPGGGSPGDGTHLLRAMLEHQLTDACFGFICDLETVEQAHAAGVGTSIQVRLGAKNDDLHGEPIETTAYVKCLTDGRFIQQSPMGAGGKIDLGRMARLIVGGIDVLISEIRAQTLDDEVFRLHGIDVTRYKFVALKSAGHFRASFAPLAHQIIQADTPGLTTDIPPFEFERLQRPIWPLDQDAAWP